MHSRGRRGFLLTGLGASAAIATACGKTASGTGGGPKNATGEGGEPEVSPTEDLMREHGAITRMLLIYDEAGRRLGAKEADAAIARTASIMRRFVHDYHEKQEEQEVFPRLERAGKLGDVTKVLRAQHDVGRRVTNEIERLAKGPRTEQDDGALRAAMAAFVRMYEPHAAREDTVVFPVFHAITPEKTFDELGEKFEENEHAQLGEHGFDAIVEELAGIERSLGIHDLAKFTPA